MPSNSAVALETAFETNSNVGTATLTEVKSIGRRVAEAPRAGFQSSAHVPGTYKLTQTEHRQTADGTETVVALPRVSDIVRHAPVDKHASFIPLQEWEGIVVSVTDTVFQARLIDVTLGDRIENEEVELELSDLNEPDRKFVVKGAIFRWTIGYQIERNKPRLRGYQIFFRSIPPLTEAELADARKRAELRAASIAFD